MSGIQASQTGGVMVIDPPEKDLGGFSVKRLLPDASVRRLGPFVFLDQFGPAAFAAGEGVDVRPHPHIGIATLTWLMEGAIGHKDSLGSDIVIRPGEVNWMIAGRGIVHSERTPADERPEGAPLYGLQAWLALPRQHEEMAPAFEHYGAGEIPSQQQGALRITVIAGESFGMRSPVTVFGPTLYADITASERTAFTVPPEHAERGLLVSGGDVAVDGQSIVPGQMAVLAEGSSPSVSLSAGARIFLVGGAPLDGERHLYWNFVSSRKERIEQAKSDWREGRFPRVPGDDEFIPLPD